MQPQRNHDMATAQRANAPTPPPEDRALTPQERRFLATFELAPVGLAHVGLDGHWLWVNQRLCDFLGYERDELLRSTFQDITVPEDLAADLAHVDELLAGKAETYAMEKRYVRRDGAVVWANLTVSLARAAAGEPDYFISVVEDIGERKRLELALARAERAMAARAQELDATIEAMTDGVSVYDTAGHLLRINAAGRALLGADDRPGYFTSAFPGRSQHVAVRDPQGGVVSRGEWPINRVLAGETISSTDAVELAVTTLDGRSRVLSYTGAPIREADGQVAGVVIVYRDMTERRMADRERDQMLSIVAHELRTPLTAMKARSQMMQRWLARGSGVTVEQFDQLGHDVERLERLVNDLNEAARAQQGGVELNLESCDLRGLCQQVAEEQMETTGRVIALDLPRKSLTAVVDCNRIEQVLTNLVTNAIKYSPPEAPISVALRRQGSKAHISVRDEGPGIHAEALAHVFERFYRA
ncbi:MAG: PAS domain S-box protein, partial [Ktedonobacterales bacterium]